MAWHSFSRHGLWLAGIAVLLSFGADRTLANAPAPYDPEPRGATGPAAPFVVRYHASKQDSTIVIPQKFLPQVGRYPKVPKVSSTPPQQKAINAGTLLATVISGGGLAVVFIRRRKIGATAAIATGMTLLAVAIGTTMATPPPSPRVTQGPVNSAENPAPKVTIKITESGDEIVLIVGENAPRLRSQSR
jgi:hypothetical protein